MALRSGRAIRFNESTVRPMGRTASGVRGVTLADDNDEVVGMICVEDDNTSILVVSEKDSVNVPTWLIIVSPTVEAKVSKLLISLTKPVLL